MHLKLAYDDYWGGNYWADSYWADTYWAEYGVYIPPVVPSTFPGGAVISRRLTPCILITVDGHILLNLNMNKPVYMIIN